MVLADGGSMTDIPVGREFWRDLKRQIAQRIRNPSEAEDLLHSAYLRFQRYRMEKEVNDPAAFMVRTACNLGIDNYRRRKPTIDTDNAESVEDLTPLQDEVVASRARLRRVQLGIERLHPRTRQIFIMHRWHELKYQEIAQRLDISVSAVEKHIAKAMLFLSEWTEGW
jgi:RNA polymerase sigma-70 factor (ECF subfamily)